MFDFFSLLRSRQITYTHRLTNRFNTALPLTTIITTVYQVGVASHTPLN